MNENLNLVEILMNAPMGTKLWSPAFGEVKFGGISDEPTAAYPIEVIADNNMAYYFTADGRHYVDFPGECMLFPSKEQRDWSKFKVETVKPKVKVTLHPFDWVLGRDNDPNSRWSADFFSYYDESVTRFPCVCTVNEWTYVIPYNERTAHLLGTTDECPIDYELTYSKEYRHE